MTMPEVHGDLMRLALTGVPGEPASPGAAGVPTDAAVAARHRPWNRLARPTCLLRRPADALMQFLWFALPRGGARTGYDHGLLTWLRRRRHRALRRPLRICLLAEPGNHFAHFTAFWINERSRLCSAAVNEDPAAADILWVYGQDPLPGDLRATVERLTRLPLNRPPLVINTPDRYDCYHDGDFFPMLEAGGVAVPRSRFGPGDIGSTWVVYKFQGQQHAPKQLRRYEGEIPGWRAFEFVDSRQADGRYVRCRAFYLLGLVRPAELFLGPDWNVCLSSADEIRYSFDVPPEEAAAIRRIAALSGLDFFAVDYLRRGGDGPAVFVDLNVHPAVTSFPHAGRDRRHFGQWHTFDTCRRLGLPEPLGRSMWDLLDERLLRLVEAGPQPVAAVAE
jgi:hypothetical protein